MLIVLLVLRAWYRSALLSPYSRPYNSNDTYMHHRVRIVRILTLSNPVYVHTVPTAVGRPDAFPRVRASASLDRGRSTPRDGTRRGASTDDRSRTPAVVVGARRTPRTRSIGRAGGGAREDELEREKE